MPLSQEPLKSRIAKPIDPATKVFAVKQTLTTLTVRSVGQLKVGQTINFDRGKAFGRVASVESDTQATVILNASLPIVRRGVVQLINPVPPLLTNVMVDLSTIGRLSVRAVTRTDHVKGTLGWSLVKRLPGGLNTTVAVGNDYETPGFCTINGTGEWEAGLYILLAKVYRLPTAMAISSGKKSFKLVEATSIICSGNYNDDKNPLILT